MKKYNLIYDATMLTNEFYQNAARSGIFFVAKNIFEELTRRNDINLYLWCNPSKYHDLKKYLELYNLQNIKIFNAKIYGFWETLKETSRNQKSRFSKKEHPYKRTIAIFLYNIASVGVALKDIFITPLLLNNDLKSVDFYFSPCHGIPNIIKKQKHILASLYLYDIIPILFPSYSQTKVNKNYWLTKLLKTLCKNEIYFAISECTKNDLLKYMTILKNEQIIVNYLAASDNFKDLRSDAKINEIKEKYNIPDGKYIFSLCTLEPRKNLLFTIKNFINFIKKHNIDDLYFVLGGAAWDEFIPLLEKEISNLNQYKSKIIKAGYVDDEDLPYLYSNSLFFTFISKYEGFGLPILEAMKCGVPVITSNVSSLPEVIGDAGIKINPNDDEACVKAFEELYFDEEKRNYYANAGLERAKEFSWKKCTDIIISNLIRRKHND